jgi:hypothetical protein
MGTWVGKNSEGVKNDKAADEDDDDRRIRFTIGGAGRRLTKDDFLREIQNLDPKARSEIIQESDAPTAMKAMAKKDANTNSGISRLYNAKNTQVAAGKDEAKSVGAEMARQRGARVEQETDDEDEREMEKTGKGHAEMNAIASDKMVTTAPRAPHSYSGDEPESVAERKRRDEALRGVDDVADPPRGRSPTRDEATQPQETAAARRRRLAMEGGGGPDFRVRSSGIEGESAAERRRREAALGVSVDDSPDSDDDDSPRVPPPVATRSRGIRFAQSPVRGKK